MANITAEERDAMARLMAVMNGTPMPPASTNLAQQKIEQLVELAGPGQVTRADVSAMADILSRIQTVNPTSILTENVSEPELDEAFLTEKTPVGVTVGKYQIMIKEDPKRLAGKQFYSIYHTATNDIIASDISLYETALAAVRLLNNGKFVNNIDVRKLFENDDSYTSHRVDAILYKRRLTKGVDPVKQDIYESRYQASIDRAMDAKKRIKQISSNAR